MKSRLRTALCVSLCVAGWLSFAATTAEAQVGFARAAVNQYINGGYSYYGGNGGYGYQPRYYGGYGNGYSYGNGNGYSYGNGNGYYGNSWNGYQSSYPTYGYSRAYGGYGGGYPVYTSGYRGAYFGY